MGNPVAARPGRGHLTPVARGRRGMLAPVARRRRAWRASTILLVALAGAGAAGCGLGPGPTPGGVRLTVTDGFGSRLIYSGARPRISGQDTVMRLLQRNGSVTTRYGGGFVQSIDGLAGGQVGGRPVDWFYYVNGIEAPVGAASTTLRAGDRVWWDRHDWGAAMETPAVVGSFPEPFTDASGEHRTPVMVECERPGSAPCQLVGARLAAVGVPARRSSLSAGPVPSGLRVLVGRWASVRTDRTAATLERGPAATGVFARPDPTGRTLTMLDQTGRAASVLEAGSGLVAATRTGDADPVWLVTGTDWAGVAAAARVFDAGDLRDHFALAVSAGRRIALPQVRS